MGAVRCALIGAKLSHSYSKLIHDRFNKYEYELLSFEPQALDDFLKKGDFDGLNITIPYKQAVIPYCDSLSKSAESIGSVNTIVKTARGLEGFNTDYYGFAAAARRANIDFKGKSTVILGSGGTSLTAQAVARDQGAKKVRVVSRSGRFNYGDLSPLGDCEILVNTTPVGMYPNNGRSVVELDAFPNCEAVMDVIYNPLRTPLVLGAQARGLKSCGGLFMLVAQAAKSAELFCGEKISGEEVQRVFRSLALEVQNIALIGMPGSGKSTVGALIAEKSGREFADTDDMVVRKQGMSIPEIFGRRGEEYFRRAEREAVADLAKRSGLVIATGGGAPLDARNYRALAENSRIYYLERQTQLLETHGRPLSTSGEALERMLETREPVYLACADCIIKNNGSPQSAAEEILRDFERSF